MPSPKKLLQPFCPHCIPDVLKVKDSFILDADFMQRLPGQVEVKKKKDLNDNFESI